MKKFIAAVCGIFILFGAKAEIAPDWYYEQFAPATEEVVTDEPVQTTSTAQVVTPIPATPGATRTAAAPMGGRATAPQQASRTISRAVPAGGASVVARTTAPRAVSARTATTTVSRAPTGQTASRAATQNNSANTVAARRAVRTGATTTARAAATPGLTQTNTVTSPLYIGNNADSRIGIRSSVMRAPIVRSASSGQAQASGEASPEAMEDTAVLLDNCKAHYNKCMDDFCNVLDDNQGRCSCSANISKYQAAELELKELTRQLETVAQQISYLGLAKSDIEALYTQTEAEIAMQGRTDNSQIRNDLDKILNSIPQIGVKNATSNAGLTFDLSGLLEFDLSEGLGFDLMTFMGGSNQSSISNQRGAELYKTAAARCKATVLDSCTQQGLDPKLITNSYDLEIDKQCIVYERSLNDAQEQLDRTTLNAQAFLRNARLLVSQQKNQFDMRQCVNELDTCMQDEFVCGQDYEDCLDPTGRYFVNGSIVPGSTPGAVSLDTATNLTGIFATWNYGSNANAWSGDGNLVAYIDATWGNAAPNNTTEQNATKMARFLQNKIGYVVNNVPTGMCVSVLQKCQNYTFNNAGRGGGTFNPQNAVTKEFLNRTLISIKAAQDNLIADYASTCKSEVFSCLSTNSGASGYYYSSNMVLGNAAKNACRPVATTCASVLGESTTPAQVNSLMDTIWQDSNYWGDGEDVVWYLNGGSWTHGAPITTWPTGNTTAYLLPTYNETNAIIKPPVMGATDGQAMPSSLTWYTDENCTSTIITEIKGPIRLYAQWRQDAIPASGQTVVNCTKTNAPIQSSGCRQYCPQ